MIEDMTIRKLFIAGWRTFLRNYAPDIAAMNPFVVPTIGFDLLYVLVIVRLAAETLSGSMPQLIRLRNGSHTRSPGHSRGMRRRAT